MPGVGAWGAGTGGDAGGCCPVDTGVDGVGSTAVAVAPDWATSVAATFASPLAGAFGDGWIGTVDRPARTYSTSE